MNVNLKDIAQETGFSINTVSRALRGDTRISEKTRTLIKQTAENMGYIPNNLACSLRRGKTKTISVIAGDIANPYFAIMIKGIEAEMERYGYTVLVLNTNEDEDKELIAIKTSLQKKVDGILICPVQKSTMNIAYLKSSHIPFVLFGRRFKTFPTDYVVPDEKMGGYLATKHLLDNGHKNIIFLIANEYISSSMERIEGAQLAFSEAGMPFPKENLYYLEVAKPDIYNKMKSNHIRLDSATAFFCFSDIIAHECIYALKKIGKQVPEDISVVGFDHIQSSFLLATDITSVRSYKNLTSKTAVQILLDKMQDNDDELRCITLKVDLAPGETVRNISNADTRISR